MPNEMYQKLSPNQRKKALIKAIHEKQTEVALEIIPLLIDVNFLTLKSHYTPLHYAAENGSVAVIKALLAKGANIKSKTKEDGLTPLHYALGRLQRHARLEPESVDNIKAAIKMLTQLDPSLRIEKDNDGSTPIHEAAGDSNCTDILEFFLQTPEFPACEVDIKDRFNCTPLHDAAFHNNLEAIKILLKLGADRSVQSTQGKTPFMMAWNKELQDYLRDREIPSLMHLCLNFLEKNKEKYDGDYKSVLIPLELGPVIPSILNGFELAAQKKAEHDKQLAEFNAKWHAEHPQYPPFEFKPQVLISEQTAVITGRLNDLKV